ncbi:MAG: hypothetical protein IKK59_08020 [Lachnospiraceae bacterium]|nr:hypothetical protein [Lachnospiraceae bacterium]
MNKRKFYKGISVLAALLMLFLVSDRILIHGYAVDSHGQQAVELTLHTKNAEENVPFQMNNLFPGDSMEQSYRVKVTCQNTVNVGFRIEGTTGSEKLAEVLKVRVSMADSKEPLYEGTLADMEELTYQLAAGDEEQTKELCYDIKVSLSTDVGNEYQNQVLKADFIWSMEYDDTADETEEEPGTDEPGASNEQESGMATEDESTAPLQVSQTDAGDSSHLLLYVCLAGIALAVLLVLLLYKREKKATGRLIRGSLFVVFLIVGFTITTYALVHYQIMIEENQFQTGVVSIDMNDGAPLITKGEFLFRPGMTVEKEVRLENNSTCDVYYKLYFSDIVGELADIVMVTIKNGEEVIYNGLLTEMTRDKVKAADDVMKMGDVRQFTVFLYFSSEADNSMQAGTLSFTMNADAVQTRNNLDKQFD